MIQVEQVIEEIRATRREIEEIEETEYSPDGLVAATVSGSGKLLELDLDPRIYRHHDTRVLSASILSAVNEANVRAHRRIAELAQRLAPSGRR